MWDEGGSRGKRMHPTNNDGIKKGLNKRTNEEKYWGIAETKSGSEGIPTLRQVYQKGK